jgi:hypothetical protein
MACTDKFFLAMAAAAAFAAASAALVAEIGSGVGVVAAPATIALVITTGATFVAAEIALSECMKGTGRVSEADIVEQEANQLAYELDQLDQLTAAA